MGGLSPQKIFRPLGPPFGPKIRGEGGRVPLGLSPGSATEITLWVSDNQIIDLTSASVLLNSVLKNYMAFERIIYNLYFKRVTPITLKSIFSLVALEKQNK